MSEDGRPDAATEVSAEPVQVNGHPALLVRQDGEIDGIVAVRIENGLVTRIYYVRNPDKLSRVEQVTTVTRGDIHGTADR